jgi:hypothetical protein
MNANDPLPQSPRENVGARRLGRAGFLGVVGAGVATLFYGKQISSVTSAVTKPFADATGLSRIVPSGGWRIYTVELSSSELLALPKAEQTSTFHCVTGWTVNRVRWGGVRFHDLLEAAQPLPQAHAAHFISAEIPYDDYLQIHQVALPDVMLAYEMDGQPLLQEHGAPVRVVIPDMYGYKNVKWVNRITLVPRPGRGYWENLGYDVDAWVGRSNGYG